MKRYTLKIRLLDNSVAVDGLRTAIDDHLIRLHPRITYHLGRVISVDPQSVVVEIATDGNKELIVTHLKKIEEAMPVAIDRVAWGWSADEKASDHARYLKQDPLSDIKPDIGQVKYEMSKQTLVYRYVFMVAFTIALLTLLVTKFYMDRSLALDMTYTLVFVIWLFLLSEIPLDIRRYVEKIECGQTNLEITSWIRGKSVKMDWQEIWGMEYSYRECKLYSNKKTVRVLLNAGNVLKGKENMLKTIVERSSLNFVETNFVKTVYKRYDAPDEKKRSQ